MASKLCIGIVYISAQEFTRLSSDTDAIAMRIDLLIQGIAMNLHPILSWIFEISEFSI
jgi:hypothetical protein